ncbi:MAG: hypothetical protein ABI721_03950 [Candidatus Dojkabacteria bacterium]
MSNFYSPVDGVVKELREVIIPRARVKHFDYDHTVSEHGVTYDGDFRFDETQQSDLDNENIQLLIEDALNGEAISIITARDKSAFVLGEHIRKKILERAGELSYDTAGRLLCRDGRTPLIFVMSNCNGANSWDLFSTEAEFINSTLLPISFWENVSDTDVSDLLRATTAKETREELVTLTPQWIGGDKFFEPTNIAEAQYKIGDFALISAMGTRVNFGLDFNLILENKALQDEWLEVTGVLVIDRMTLLQAFRILTQTWGIYFAGSASRPNIDIVDVSVNKRACRDLVNDYIISVYDRYGINTDGIESIQIGDTPQTTTFIGNDAPMLNIRGGISVGNTDYHTEVGYPVVYSKGEGSVRRTNNLLKEI